MNILNSIKLIVFSPLLLLYIITDQKPIIHADVQRWLDVFHRSPKTIYGDLLFLLAGYPEFRTLFYYRLEHSGRLAHIIALVFSIFYRGRVNLFLTCPSIGPGFFIQHGFSTIVAAKKVGKNGWVNQQVTIGFTNDYDSPEIGDNVTVYCGAIVIGKIVVHDNVVVGANALVVKDVPPNCVVGGVPAKIIKKDGQRVSLSLNDSQL